jgi:PKD repeat protein
MLVLGACAAGESLLGGGLEPPATLTATPLNLTTIRLDWSAPPAGDLQLFRIQRRSDFRGAFRTLAEVTPGTTTYFDSGLEPATFYGYRIVTVDRLGESSQPSVVAGAQTPPLPGIRISTSLSGSPAGSADPNGYLVRVTGARDTAVTVGSVDARVLSPLPVGTYTLTLEDVAPTCAIQGGATRTVVVSDTGLTTQPPAAFDATCVDPTRGTVVAVVAVEGDSVDADGYRLDFAAIITGDTLPVLGGTSIAGIGESRSFPNLRPGDYQFTLSGVDAPCQLAGPVSRNAQVTPLSLDTLAFTVTCPDRGGGNPSAPFVLRNLWTPQAGGAGGTVTLELSLDLSAVPGQDVGSVQASLQYNPAVLAYVSATAPAPALMNNLTVNAATPGTVSWLNFTTGSTPPTGLVPVARFSFTVQGSTGQTAATRTAIQTIGNFDGSETLEDRFRVVEDTFTVGTGGGGANQPPVAQAGGPYSGTVGAPISFTSAGSSDPDGTIAGYGWSFGDGTTSTQANPQKSYPGAGTYTATLTVTDNQGATASDQASVTVSAGGGNQPPVAQAGGPYSGTAGAAIGFSSAGSSDPDGTITGYSWDFGDGTGSTQANPAKAYAAAGSYTVTLTVTDNQGATASDQAGVSVAQAGQPLTWSSAFGAFNTGLGTYPLVITLNLTQDVAQTPGPEALASYAVDSLVWDPAVLEYHSLIYSSGGGSINPTNATGGCKCKLSFTGVGLSPNTGIVPIATVNFRPVGASGSSATPRFFLASVLSTAPLGTYNYLAVLQQVAGSLTLP